MVNLRQIISCFVLVTSLVVLSGCEKDKADRIGRYGRLDDNTPEYTAVMFMRSIYMEPTIDGAVELSTPRLAKILKRYHTNKNVQRHLLNLKYDTVEVTPQSSQSVGRSEYADTAELSLFFSGQFNGDKVEDLRSISLVKEGGRWKVSEIHPDPFL